MVDTSETAYIRERGGKGIKRNKGFEFYWEGWVWGYLDPDG